MQTPVCEQRLLGIDASDTSPHGAIQPRAPASETVQDGAAAWSFVSSVTSLTLICLGTETQGASYAEIPNCVAVSSACACITLVSAGMSASASARSPIPCSCVNAWVRT